MNRNRSAEIRNLILLITAAANGEIFTTQLFELSCDITHVAMNQTVYFYF